MSVPEPLTEEQLRVRVMGLPALCRGVNEAVVHLRLAEKEVRDWMNGYPERQIPPIPHTPLPSGQHLFYTAEIMQWLHRYFPPGSHLRQKRARRGKGGE